jgi:hypothetical protein
LGARGSSDERQDVEHVLRAGTPVSGDSEVDKDGAERALRDSARTPRLHVLRGLIISAMCVIGTLASTELSEEDAVFICGGGQVGRAMGARILRWEFWRV